MQVPPFLSRERPVSSPAECQNVDNCVMFLNIAASLLAPYIKRSIEPGRLPQPSVEHSVGFESEARRHRTPEALRAKSAAKVYPVSRQLSECARVPASLFEFPLETDSRSSSGASSQNGFGHGKKYLGAIRTTETYI
jgi:hypothetical protein